MDRWKEGGTERGLRRWRKVRHRLHWQSPELQAEKERKDAKEKNPTVDGWCSHENLPTNFLDIWSF